MATINGDWFRAKLTEKQRSQRQLAKHLQIDPSAVTLMLRGDRKMQMDEARDIAAFIGEPLGDVLRAAGLPLKDDGGMTATPRRKPTGANADTIAMLMQKRDELMAQVEALDKAIRVLE